MIRVDNSAAGQLSPGFDTAARAATQQTGNFRGELATVLADPKSILANAAEEITFAHSEKAEAKNLSERKAEAKGRPELMEIQAITAYLEAMHHQHAQAKLEEAAARILQGRRDGTGPREEARRSFEDVSEQYAALNYAARKGEESGAGAERMEEVYEAIAELDEDYGPRIRAGINAAAAAGEFAADAGGAGALRETYRDVVLGAEGLPAALNAVLERHGLEDFMRAAQSLIRALGDDIAAARPSREPARLQAALQDLYYLEVAVTVLDSAKELSERLTREFGKAPLDSAEMMKEVIGLTSERWVSASRLSGLADKMGMADTGPQIAFLTGTKNILRELPIKVFQDGETRYAVLNAAQDALDRAIEREEAGE